jgi:hypothetical protein
MLYNFVCDKSDTIAMETSPSNVTFRRDLLGPRLVSPHFFVWLMSNYRMDPMNFDEIFTRMASCILTSCTTHESNQMF